MRIKIGHVCWNVDSGVIATIIDIQESRYQIESVSGWQYDPQNLVIIPETFAPLAAKRK